LLGSQTPCSAEDVAAMAGLSRSTARVYLDHLVEQGMAREELLYGNVGRPRRLFRQA
jgi:response regulator of citrate/malate metabolism